MRQQGRKEGKRTLKIELRGESVHISGYVNAVGRDSRPVPIPGYEASEMVEQIQPGAFGEALNRAAEVKLYLDHLVTPEGYARISDGTLNLVEDNIGLYAETDITAPEVVELAKAKKLRGWSFGMYVNDYQVEYRENGIPRRIVKSLDLDEVSIIDDKMLPVYIGTSIECRSEEENKKYIEFRAMANEQTEYLAEEEPVDYSEWEKRINKVTE